MYYFWFFIFFALTGGVSGFIAARFHKLYNGSSWILSGIVTAAVLPSFVFGCFSVIEVIDWYERSSALLPISYMIIFVAFTAVTNTYLVSIGSYFGYAKA